MSGTKIPANENRKLSNDIVLLFSFFLNLFFSEMK